MRKRGTGARDGGDDLLLPRARAGDADAFAAMIRAHDARLRGLAYRVLGDRELMDDALQEAYLRAFRALPRFRGEAQVSTWLSRITYNACLDELRRRDRGRELTECVVADPASRATDPGDRVERASAVRAALRELPPQERAVAWLVDGEGRSYAEVGEILDLAEGTVASRLSRARAALRRALESDLEQGRTR